MDGGYGWVLLAEPIYGSRWHYALAVEKLPGGTARYQLACPVGQLTDDTIAGRNALPSTTWAICEVCTDLHP